MPPNKPSGVKGVSYTFAFQEEGSSKEAQPPNPFLASSVNRHTASGGRMILLPRRYNRTDVDRIACGGLGLSDAGVSVKLHQTFLQGSVGLSRRWLAPTFVVFIVPRSAGGGRTERAGDHVSFASPSISPRSRSHLAPQPVLHAGMSGRKRSYS